MAPELLEVMGSAGAGAVVVAVAAIFHRHLRRERRNIEADRSRERRQFLATLDRVSAAVGHDARRDRRRA